MADGPTPDERVAVADELATLSGFLDHFRVVVVGKVAGVGDEAARRPRVPSGTSIGGLVKHLRWAEVGWFQQVLRDRTGGNLRPHDRAWEFRMEETDTLDDLVDAYRDTCATSREVVAGLTPDTTVPHDQMGQVTARWVLVHMIEETARHAGHLDILCEQVDGRTGDG